MEVNLKIVVFDFVSGCVIGEQFLYKYLQYYIYSVMWMLVIEWYLLVGVVKGNGFVDLIDMMGKVCVFILCMFVMVCEVGIVVNQNIVYMFVVDGCLL